MRFILHKIESIPSTIPRGGPGPLPPLAQEGVGSEGASLGGGGLWITLTLLNSKLLIVKVAENRVVSTEHNADLSSVYTSGLVRSKGVYDIVQNIILLYSMPSSPVTS